MDDFLEFSAVAICVVFGGIAGANTADNAFTGLIVGALAGLAVGLLAAWIIGQIAAASYQTRRAEAEANAREMEGQRRAEALARAGADSRRRQAEAQRRREAELERQEIAAIRRQEAERVADAQRISAAQHVLRWKEVPHSAPLNVPGGPRALACDVCSGTGRITRKQRTTEITILTPTEEIPCGACGSTGFGCASDVATLKEYLTEPCLWLTTIFDLAKRKARHIVSPEDVLPLLSKDSNVQAEGSRTDRSGALVENTYQTTQFCITQNGSFLVRKATRETYYWPNHGSVDNGWSSWEDQVGVSIDAFMSEFDFTACGIRNQSDFHEDSERVYGCEYYMHTEPDRYLTLRRLYPEKGDGLLSALWEAR